MNVERIASIVMYVLILLGTLVLFIGFFGENYDPMLNVAYIYFFVALLGVLASTVIGALANPKSVKGSLIGIGVMVLIVGVSYAMSSGEILSSYPKTVTEGSVKWSEAGLYTLYVLFVGAIGAIIYSGVAKFIHR
jgi:hypothetical membrane protein